LPFPIWGLTPYCLFKYGVIIVLAIFQYGVQKLATKNYVYL